MPQSAISRASSREKTGCAGDRHLHVRIRRSGSAISRIITGIAAKNLSARPINHHA
jgi:hypothetical protein